jgi:chromosome segregation ATPase
MARLDDAATVSKNALEDEREKRRAVSHDLDDLRKAHRKLESDMAMLEIQVAEQRLLVESKDEHLHKCEEEIRHLVRSDNPSGSFLRS